MRVTAATDTVVSLVWDASTDNVGVIAYDIYERTFRIATTSGTSHTITNMGPNYAYNLTVRARDAAGNVSAPSTVVEVRTVPEGLVAAYAFDEGSGTTVFDAADSNDVGSISGASWTTEGRFGKALDFDGVNDIVTVNDSPALDLEYAMTLEAWVYATEFGRWQTIIFKELTTTSLAYALYADSEFGVPVGAASIAGFGYTNVQGDELIPVNTWTHLVVTYNGMALTLYVNGTPLRSTPQPSRIDVSDDRLSIGGNTIFDGDYFRGRIDNVRIYDRYLVPEEIAAVMNVPVIGTMPFSPTPTPNPYPGPPTPTPTSAGYPPPEVRVEPSLSATPVAVSGEQINQVNDSTYLPIVVRGIPLPPEPTTTPTPLPVNQPPLAPADTFYVEDNWNTMTLFNGEMRTLAYQFGYNADVAVPSSQGSRILSQIILGFGRQRYDMVGEVKQWGVNLPREAGLQNNDWVRQVAQEFYNGYSANPDHRSQTSIVVIGTSNGNYNWTCDNQTPTISPDWREAGEVWANLVDSVVETQYVIKRAGNDFESWQGEFDRDIPDENQRWTACGVGALVWFSGYETRSDETLPMVVNYGSQASFELPRQWTSGQVFEVSAGRVGASVYPQIFCPGSPRGWVDLRRGFQFQFQGVTSTNGVGDTPIERSLCGAGIETLAWDEAWTTLNNALSNATPIAGDNHPAPYRDNLDPSVSSFFYSP